MIKKVIFNKNNIIFLFITVLLFIALFFPISGCACWKIGPGYPPNDRIIDPPMAFDRQGNIITAYQGNTGKGPDTYVEKIDTNGNRLWEIRLDTRLPEPQTDKDPRPSYTQIVSDGEGNAVVCWNYKDQILAKKLDINGNPAWKDEMIVIGTSKRLRERIIFSNINGITAAWIDLNNNLSLSAIGGNGNILWSGNKYALNIMRFDAYCDNQGNIWIIWGQSSDESIHLQKVNSQGQIEWAKTIQEGLTTTVPTSNEGKYIYWVIDDSSGKAILGWANRWKYDGTNFRKVDSQGTILWNINNFNAFRITTDQDGGIFTFWSINHSTYAQHINSEGKALWGDNGREVIKDNGEGIVDVATDNFGGAIIIWNSQTNNGYIFHAQRIDNHGIKPWGDDNGMIISSPLNSYMNAYLHIMPHIPMVTFDGINSYFISYAGLSSESYVQKIEEDGTLPWGLSGLRLQ